MPELLSHQQWSSYWRNKTLTSFHGHFDENYDGPLRDFWNEIFAGLSANARIVDLATGNGALALLAAGYSRQQQRSFEVTGIDFASTTPLETLAERDDLKGLLANIKFIPECRMEHTGLPSGYFDLVMSQFGFEYGDTVAAIAEVDRLLNAQGGRFAAMMHHKDSAVLSEQRDSRRQINYCDRSQLFEIVGKMLALQEKLEQQGSLTAIQRQRGNELWGQFDQKIKKAKRFSREFKNPSFLEFFCGNLLAIYDQKHANTMSIEDKRGILKNIEEEGQRFRDRMNDLHLAAVDDKRLDKMKQLLKSHGFNISRLEPFDYKNQFFCIALIAEKSETRADV